MGDAVENTIELAVKGLTERKSEYFAQVHTVEKSVNTYHIECLFDLRCYRYRR